MGAQPSDNTKGWNGSVAKVLAMLSGWDGRPQSLNSEGGDSLAVAAVVSSGLN